MINLKWFIPMILAYLIGINLVYNKATVKPTVKVDTVYIPRPVFVYVHDTVYTSQAEEFDYPEALSRAQQDSVHRMFDMVGM